MKRIIFDATIILLPAFFIYIGLLVLSYKHYPQLDHKVINTAKAVSSFLSSPPAYLVYNSSALANAKPIMLLIGPSNVNIGFPVGKLQTQIPEIVVHNATIGGARIDGMSAVVDLVYSQRPKKYRAKTVFIFGLWWGEFLHSGRNRSSSPVAQQMGRFNFFSKTSEGYNVVLRPELFRLGVEIMRPFFIGPNLMSKDGLLFGGTDNAPNDPDAETIGRWVCNSEVAKSIREEQQKNFAQIGHAQFVELVEITREIKEKGGKILLVDLPQAKCSKKVSGYWKDYQDLKAKYISEAISLGAYYLDLGKINDDSYFIDITHPSKKGASAWTLELSDYLKTSGILSSR